MSTAPSENAFARLFDAILAETPMLVRKRQMLPALDWRQIRSDQIEAMISRLMDEGLKIPRWLAQDLLCAGHVLQDQVLAVDAAVFAQLSALNTSAIDLDGVLAAAREVLSPGFLDPLPDKVAEHLAVRFADLGAPDAAAQLALRARSLSPAGQRAVKPHLDGYLAALPEVRLRICGSASTQALAAALPRAFASSGFRAAVSESDYGALMSELIRPGADVDALVVLLDHEYFMPKDWRRSADRMHNDLEQQAKALADALHSYCTQAGVPLITTTLPSVAAPSAGYADQAYPAGAARTCSIVNDVLLAAAEETPLLCVLDSDQAMSALAPASRCDHKLWYYGRFAYSEAATHLLAAAMARWWHARTKGPAKVLALDFDNTLWGGVFGDDGIAKLQCGDDFPGSAFKAFQTECLRLKSQGMILVGLSKNNDDALAVFSDHPGMLLNRDDFVATAVNWEPKPGNIRRIAGDLQIGLDSVLFLDDSPHERSAMRRLCPEVIVPEMPSDPALRPAWLRSLAITWPLRITAEDERRTGFYAAEYKARELRASAANYDEYLASLEQKLTISPLSVETLPRVAQLHLRTNQFNLTTERLTEADLRQFVGQNDRLAVSGSVTDRFGDHGLVIAATVECDGSSATIRSFIMSCRVIGRQVERAFLGALLDMLCSSGIGDVTGLFKLTPKNAVSSKFYSDSGFTYEGTADGAERWRFTIMPGCTMPRSEAVQVARSN